MNKFLRILKHRWLDRADTHRLIPDDMAQRLAQRVAASEARHSGEVRLCVEAALPLSYLWRLGPTTSIGTLTRQRAVSWFGRLGVWDTEHNNGVLIYLLLAEHAIEIVADRGLARHVPLSQWDALLAGMRAAFRAGRFEEGLAQAIAAVHALLLQHYPLAEGQVNPDELPNRADLR